MGWFNLFQNDDQERPPQRLPLSQRDEFRRNVVRALAIAFILGFVALAVAVIVIATSAKG